MKPYSEMTREELQELKKELSAEYKICLLYTSRCV